MDDLLYQYNPWWEHDISLEGIIERSSYVDRLMKQIPSKTVLFLTGLRRVGKTTLMKIIIKKLIDQGVDAKHVLYISADDYLLKGKTLFEIIDAYRILHKIRHEEKMWFFFDEITYQPDYHQQIKNLYDRFNTKIIATSSSSSLLRDNRAYLTGRALTLEIYPLDFTEYKAFKGIGVKRSDRVLDEAYFRDYLKDGGLPENVLKPDREYLMSLVDDIIQKDITAHHGLKNHHLLRDYFTLLMERSGKQLSINRIANILKISPDTSKRYLSYFEDTFLIHLLPRWGKTNERLLSPKKPYACDLGIKYLFMGERDLGSYFENYVYLELRKKKDVFYLYEDGIEIDFYTADRILVESKYGSELTTKQTRLFDSYPADRRIVIDSVSSLEGLNAI